MEQFLSEHKEVAKVSIETTISELIDIRDALDNASTTGEKYDALNRTIESYEALRRKFLMNATPTPFECQQWKAIFHHRKEVLERKWTDLTKAKTDYSILVNELDSILEN